MSKALRSDPQVYGEALRQETLSTEAFIRTEALRTEALRIEALRTEALSGDRQLSFRSSRYTTHSARVAE